MKDNVIKIRKNKRRPSRRDIGLAGGKIYKAMALEDQRAFNHSAARFKRALKPNTTGNTTGLDLMVNVNYYKEHGCLPENCGMGLKKSQVS
jgi:hypothetical protein